LSALIDGDIDSRWSQRIARYLWNV